MHNLICITYTRIHKEIGQVIFQAIVQDFQVDEHNQIMQQAGWSFDSAQPATAISQDY